MQAITQTKMESTDIKHLIESEFAFEVLKKPLKSVDGLSTPVFGLFRSDNDDFVGGESVSERYVPHNVDDVSALVEAAAGLFDGELSIRTMWDNGHVIIIQPLEHERYTINGADGMIPALVIRAQYNKRSFSANMGMFRFLCENMLMLSSMKGTSVKIRHTNSLREKMDTLIATFSGLDKSFDILMDGFMQMNNNWFKLSYFVTEVIGDRPEEEGSKRTRWDNTCDTIKQIIANERQALTGEFSTVGDSTMCTGWELYNAVQGYSQHKKTRRNDPSRDQRAILASDDTMVRKAEELALAV